MKPKAPLRFKTVSGTSVDAFTVIIPDGAISAGNNTPNLAAGQPYDLACSFVGIPTASAVLLRFVAVRAFTLSASGQQGVAGTAATAQTDFLVKVGSTTKATLRFAAAGTVASVVGGTAATIAAGDVITITAPASPDATLADLGFTLTGVLL